MIINSDQFVKTDTKNPLNSRYVSISARIYLISYTSEICTPSSSLYNLARFSVFWDSSTL